MVNGSRYVNVGSMQEIIHYLGYHKVCYQWIQHLLTDTLWGAMRISIFGTYAVVLCGRWCTYAVECGVCGMWWDVSHYCTHGKISRQAMESWSISPQPQKIKSQAPTSKVMLTYLTLGTLASGLIVQLTPSVQTITVKVLKRWDQEQDKLFG